MLGSMRLALALPVRATPACATSADLPATCHSCGFVHAACSTHGRRQVGFVSGLSAGALAGKLRCERPDVGRPFQAVMSTQRRPGKAVLRACRDRLTSVFESCLIMPPSPHRLLIDPPGSGAWNMAVDETLLEWAAECGGCAWRFYQWSEPTLSLGYFQAFDAEKSCVPFSAIVRRLTGGGAILHDRELTYSLVVPAGHALAARRETLYDAVHRSLIETLAGFGVTAALCAPIRRVLLVPILSCVSSAGRSATCSWARPKSPAAPNAAAAGPCCSTAASCCGGRRPHPSCQAWKTSWASLSPRTNLPRHGCRDWPVA